jgi:hypothetical protein
MENSTEKARIQYLLSGLKKCDPISDELLIRLLERVDVYSN